jgi:hypothetical protein
MTSRPQNIGKLNQTQPIANQTHDQPINFIMVQKMNARMDHHRNYPILPPTFDC